VLTSGISRRFWVIKAVGLQRYTRMLAHEVWNVSGVRLMIYSVFQAIAPGWLSFGWVLWILTGTSFRVLIRINPHLPRGMLPGRTHTFSPPLFSSLDPSPTYTTPTRIHVPFCYTYFRRIQSSPPKPPHLEVSYVQVGDYQIK